MKLDGGKILTSLAVVILSYIGITVTDNASLIKEISVHSQYQSTALSTHDGWMDNIDDWKYRVDLRLNELYNKLNNEESL